MAPKRKPARKVRREGKPLPVGEYRTGSVQELLNLSDADMAIIEIKVALTKAMLTQRKSKKLTQADLAKFIGSSQSRVAALEKGEGSLEAMITALVALGFTRRQIVREIAKAAA